MTVENPGFGDIVVLPSDKWQDLPDVNAPYYVLAQEGLFAHRRTAQGRGVIKAKKMPSRLPKLGTTNGWFTFDANPVPDYIYAQAVHFFRRVFEKHHTEAEVIITQHKDTAEYRLFIPTQDVSHGAVRSIYNPAHIGRDYLVVGTFHSHCDFGPGHSSTDEGDARDMDGLHGTIGYVNRAQPEMALMYALNGVFMHFNPPFDGVVDTTNLDAGQAPEWWDRYLILDKLTDADRQRVAPYASDEDWDRFMGRHKNITVYGPYGTNYSYTPAPQTKHTNGHTQGLSRRDKKRLRKQLERYQGSESFAMLQESIDFNNRILRPTWGHDGELTGMYDGGSVTYTEDYWEDALGPDYVASIVDSGLFTEDDLERAIYDYPESATQPYWERRFKVKLLRARSWLKAQGIEATVTLTDNRVKTVPGQTEMSDYIGGAL